MLFHLKLQNLLTMLSEDLLDFVKYSVREMESDWARSTSLAQSCYTAALDEVLAGVLKGTRPASCLQGAPPGRGSEKTDMLGEFRVREMISCPWMLLSTERLERPGEWGFRWPWILQCRE